MHISVHNVNTLQGFEMQISTNPPLIFVNCAQFFFSIIYSPIFLCLCFFCANHIFFENRGKFWHCQYSILVVECTFSDQKNSDKKKRLTKKKNLPWERTSDLVLFRRLEGREWPSLLVESLSSSFWTDCKWKKK